MSIHSSQMDEDKFSKAQFNCLLHNYDEWTSPLMGQPWQWLLDHDASSEKVLNCLEHSCYYIKLKAILNMYLEATRVSFFLFLSLFIFLSFFLLTLRTKYHFQPVNSRFLFFLQ